MGPHLFEFKFWIQAVRIKDKRVLKFIRKYLTAGTMIDGLVTFSTEGTPQGGPLSPLLSNIVLDELDKELEKRGLRFVRYAFLCGNARKKMWRMSRIKWVIIAMPNKYFLDRGLFLPGN